jgi:phenylacetate-CoA ligase
MSLVVGRTDDMLIIRGINVFPSQVEAVVVDFAELSPHYQLQVTREGTLDDLEVRIESAPAYAPHGDALCTREAEVKALAARVTERLRGVTAVAIRVNIVPPGTLPRSEGGKLRRVVDERSR